MKKRFLLIACFLLTLAAYAQTTDFYVAKQLRDISVPEQIPLDEDVKDILRPYFPNDSITIEVLHKNPFFVNLFVPGAGAGSFDRLRTITKKAGGIDVTTIANGIADLMIERAKQELTISFFERFIKFADKNPEFKVLFPKTTENLSTLLSYTYPQMLPSLRNSFFADLSQLTYHLEALLETERYKVLLQNFPEVKVAIRSLRILHDLENSTSNAADIIRDFASIPEFKDPNNTTSFKNTGNLLRLASIISESLRAAAPNVWITPAEAKPLVTDEFFCKIFLGLLYQRIIIEDLKFYRGGTTERIADIFAKQKDNIFLIQNRLSEFLSITGKVNESLKDFEMKKGAGILVDDDYYDYINVSLDAVDYGFNIVLLFDDRFQGGKYLDIARKSNELYKNIYSREYTDAISNGVDILTCVHDLIDENKNVPETKVSAVVKKDKLDKLFNFVEDLKPYALFMANMVEAKTSDDVKAALDNVILPVGSSSIKKVTDCNLSIQSYLGARWTSSDLPNKGYGAWSDRFGVSAPIGFSWTPGLLSWQKRGSLSLFVPLFDLGAIVDYKLKRDSVVNDAGDKTAVISKDYSIKLGQIISPGVYAVYGFFGNLPLSVGFGAQYGPGLSKIDSNNEAITYNPSWRFNFFLAVDLPFFNLYNKTKRPARKK